MTALDATAAASTHGGAGLSRPVNAGRSIDSKRTSTGSELNERTSAAREGPWNITCSDRRRSDRIETLQPSFGTRHVPRRGRRAESRPFSVVQPPLGTCHVPSANEAPLVRRTDRPASTENSGTQGSQGRGRADARRKLDSGAEQGPAACAPVLNERMPGDTQDGAAGQGAAYYAPGSPCAAGVTRRLAEREGYAPSSPSGGVTRRVRPAPGRSTRHSRRPPALRAGLAPP